MFVLSQILHRRGGIDLLPHLAYFQQEVQHCNRLMVNIHLTELICHYSRGTRKRGPNKESHQGQVWGFEHCTLPRTK